MNTMHQANRGYWNEAAEWWERLEEEGGLWKRCPYEPELAFDEGSLGLVREAAGTSVGQGRVRRWQRGQSRRPSPLPEWARTSRR